MPSSRQVVWKMLNDPTILQLCIPGCEELTAISATEFEAVAVNKIGPIRARFKGTVRLSDINPEVGYRIVGHGNGGIAGFAEGQAAVFLSDAEGGTLLRYDVEAKIGGKLAQLGQRLIDGAARKIADEFFSRLSKQVSNSLEA